MRETGVAEQLNQHSQLTRAITASNFILVLVLIMSYILPPMRPCSLLPRMSMGYEHLGSEWQNKTTIFSCSVVSLRRRWFGLFGKLVPTVYCTPSNCTASNTTNDKVDITATPSSCQCPDCSDRRPSSASALFQWGLETETVGVWAQGNVSRHVVELTTESVHEEVSNQEMFQYWIHNGSKLVDEITSKLGTKKEDIDIEAAKKVAACLTPPLPPSDTVKGYNPWLDKPRPTTIEEYLRIFEVLFVVDDSGSMEEGARWNETRDALATISEKAFELDVDTVSLRFLNNETYVRGLKGRNNLTSLFDTMWPEGWTPLGIALRAVFNEHLNRIDAVVRNGREEYSKIPPLDIIVLTDGVPTDEGEDEPANVIANAVKKLNDSHYHPNTMGVQIVQIANAEEAKKALKDIVVGDNGRIVDTVPYAGVVDSQKLLRILLGGVHPNIRSQLPVAMLAI